MKLEVLNFLTFCRIFNIHGNKRVHRLGKKIYTDALNKGEKKYKQGPLF
jgi:hypothetical protein